MKLKLIISLFVMLCGISYAFSHGHAKDKNDPEPATHMWIRTGDTVTYVPLKWLPDCEMLTQQAATINSSEANCYFGPNLLKTVNCQKSVHTNRKPKCS